MHLILSAFLVCLNLPRRGGSELVEVSCKNCPGAERTPDMIKAEEMLRKDMIHSRLLEAFKNVRPLGKPIPLGARHPEIPTPITDELREFATRHFEDTERQEAKVHRVYLLADNIRTIRQRSSRSTNPCANVEVKIPADFDYNRVKRAVMWMYPLPFPDTSTTVELRDTSPNPCPDRTTETVEPELAAQSKGWLHFDVSGMFRHWRTLHQNTTTVKTVAVAASNPSLAVASSADKRPYVEIEVERKLSRRKRFPAARQVCPESSFSFCCRKPLFFNFTEYNWTFIRQPRDGLDVGYCSGNCRVITKTRHTIIRNEAAKTNTVVYPCCTPSRFSDASIIYTYNDTVVTGLLPKLVVESCDCGL